MVGLSLIVCVLVKVTVTDGVLVGVSEILGVVDGVLQIERDFVPV